MLRPAATSSSVLDRPCSFLNSSIFERFTSDFSFLGLKIARKYATM
uniref:Uncharacterized protein n=1 Tax=Myoviridae sp. ctsIb3 TaxID=2825189 RepID=A0A8S5URB5_9CAUD|nr:MAG TPA: hypothetical protein [Myoviridae sp. ctsIb3]